MDRKYQNRTLKSTGRYKEFFWAFNNNEHCKKIILKEIEMSVEN